MGPELQLVQDSQQTTPNVVSPETFKDLFVYPKFVTVQGSPENRLSWIAQLSAANLNSWSEFFSTTPDASQILSPSGSDIAQQFPHQLLNEPLTSGVVNPEIELMST